MKASICSRTCRGEVKLALAKAWLERMENQTSTWLSQEVVGVQLACLGGSRYRPLETGHRSCTALTNRKASSNRSGTRCRRPQPHAGAGTPELRPHRMRPREPGITASTRLIHATRSRLPGLAREEPGRRIPLCILRCALRYRSRALPD